MLYGYPVNELERVLIEKEVLGDTINALRATFVEYAYTRGQFPSRWWTSPQSIPRIARYLATGVPTRRALEWGRNRVMAEMLAQAPRCWLQF
jgi:hypothetical protein